LHLVLDLLICKKFSILMLSILSEVDAYLHQFKTWQRTFLNSGGNITREHLIHFPIPILLHTALFEPLAFIIVSYYKKIL
jgi:hypothetical protein